MLINIAFTVEFPPQEGDRAAHYEKSQCAIKRNSETIRQLRQNNKRLYQKLSETNTVRLYFVANFLVLLTSSYFQLFFVVFCFPQGDEIIIRMAFGSRGPEREAFRNMSGKVGE